MKRICALFVAGLLAAGGTAAGRPGEQGIHSPRGRNSPIVAARLIEGAGRGPARPASESSRSSPWGASEVRSLATAGSVPATPPRRPLRPRPAADRADIQTSEPIPYTSSPVLGDYTEFPLSTNGRLFTTFPSGATALCSGTVISGGANNPRGIVLTAARCVHRESFGGFVTKAIFVPAFSGNRPFGEWPAKYVFVPSQWIDGGENVRYDVATLYIPARDGDSLIENTGGMGLRWNQAPRVLSTRAFGYPGTGLQMFRCTSETHFGFEPQPPGLGDPTIAIGCDLPAAGTAGGGWVVEDSAANDSYVTSLFSYKVAGENEVSFGPYFNSTTRDLWLEAATADLVRHKMKLTLKLNGRLVARGKITARDGYRPCRINAPIRIQSKNRGKWRTIKKTTSKGSGSYRVKIPNRPGLYRAFSPAGSVNAFNSCSSAKSPTRRAKS